MEISVKIYSTDDNIILTVPKVASTLLSSMYDDEYIGGMKFDYNINIEEGTITPRDSNHNSLTTQTISDIQNIFTNKSEKNLIVLYRNPQDRLKSAIIQDFVSQIVDNESADFLLSVLYKIFNTPYHVQTFIRNNKHSFHLSSVETPEVEVFLEKSLIYFMDFLSKDGYSNHHASEYLNYFYIFLMKYQIDLSKLILCDIDSGNFDGLIKHYNLNVNYKQKNSNSQFKYIINNILDDENNKHIADKFFYKIERENTFYDILKNNPNNFK